MQTFLPYPDFYRSAAVLDWRRLGKQRVEAYQILLTLQGRASNNGWSRHPAALMWSGHDGCLGLYMNAMIAEWVRRGYRNTMQPYAPHACDDLTAPAWLGDDDFHASHRSNLLRKEPTWYSNFGWVEPPDLEYVWPVRAQKQRRTA